MRSSESLCADILVVDDHPHNLEVLRMVLEAEGHRVHVEADGEGALAAAASMPFDLALIDVCMPHMDGYELCSRLKEDRRTANIPIIFLSALDESHNKVQAFDSGGVDYIVKPFKVVEVLARVSNQLRNAAIHRHVQAKNEELRKRNLELMSDKTSGSRPSTPGRRPPSLLKGEEAQGLFDGKYELHEVIGHGGFGEVRRARHVVLDRQLALKLIRPGQAMTMTDMERVRIEGMSACRVDHPNAVAIWDAGVTPEGVIYLVMELLSGHSLRDELAKIGKIGALRCLSIARATCDVLAMAHTAGVIHRDIKPDNIFLHIPREGEEMVKVVDFGIAKLVGGASAMQLTADGQMIGTPQYVAPERLLGKPYDGRSDIYSLGCVMYEMLSGAPPFVSNPELPWLVGTMHVGEAPIPLQKVEPSVPKELAELVHMALCKDPADRPTATVMLILMEHVFDSMMLLGETEEPCQRLDEAPESGEVLTVPLLVKREGAQ